MTIIDVKLLGIYRLNKELIISKTGNCFKFPAVVGCHNEALPVIDLVPVLVEDCEGNKYVTLFCKECATRTYSNFTNLVKESLVPLSAIVDLLI